MKKTRLANVLLTICSIVASLLLVEGILYCLGYETTVATGDQYVFFRYDPVMGWANKAGVAGIFTRRDFRTRVAVNSQEMRDSREFSKEKGSGRRIAILGDSFSWGHGVEENERYSNLLEKRLGGNAEVLNFSVTGFGPTQYLLQLDSVLEYLPDVVIVGFCLSNDFNDNVLWKRYLHYYGPYAEIVDGELKVSGYPIPDARKFGARYTKSGFLDSVLARSRLYHLISDVAATRADSSVDAPAQRGLLGFAAETMYRPGDPLRDEAIRINEAVLAAMKEKLAARGVEFAVLFVPTKYEYQPSGENFDPDGARQALRLSLDKLGVAHIDAVDALTLDDFFPHDGHWNARGHVKTADAAFRFLSGEERQTAADKK